MNAAAVEALAPDTASVVAARRLARPGPWSQTGHDARAVWGLCKGSGARPYQTQAELSGPAFKCSCPSRKVPCKHALALLLLHAGGGVAAGEPPEWVVEWLSAREKRAASRPAPGEPVRDPEAAARRAAEREARMAAGVDDLRRWLRDAVRGGLGAERLRSWAEWDAFAARLVDAQAPGAASRLRSLGGVAAGRRDDWPARLLEGLGLLHLLCEAHGRAGGPLRDDVRALLGRPVPREEALAGERVHDRWAVLARIVIEQERLSVQRTWLWGTASGRPALLLDFAPPGAPLEPRPPAGALVEAELAYHPSATPLRALPASELRAIGAAGGLTAGGGVSPALAAAADALAANPWLEAWPVALAEAVVDGPQPWRVGAPDGSLPLRGGEERLWRLLAFGGGRPVTVFGLWDGEALVPLAAGDDTRLVAVSWDELVAAALVGTERRPVAPDAPPGAPPGLGGALRERGEDGVLGAAAAWTVARRAGAVPGPPLEVEPAGEDPRPLCSPEAAARLAWLLDAGDDRLLEEWLELAAERGVRPPPELIPALLDDALGDPARQLLAVAAAGPLGRWLAARADRWGFVPGAEDPEAVWQHGERDARRLLLTRLRLRDPAAGRGLLERTLRTETAEDRAAFVRALAAGLGDADEPLLERALGDRRQEVRAAAAALLARLPRSRFGARMAERAAPLLAVEAERLVVTLPGEPDAAARRDGVPRSGRRADALAHILARTPLATWTQRFERSPAEIAALPVADDFREVVHGAFARAALDQRDEAWARALWRTEPRLLAVLPREERERVAARHPDAAPGVPAPWGEALSRAVAQVLRRLIEAGERPPSELAYALDPAVLGVFEPLAEDGGAPVRRLCDVLATRGAMLRELS